MATPSISPADLDYMLEHVNDNKSAEVVVACAVCGAIAYVAVALRLYARKLGRVEYGLDELFIGFALVTKSALHHCVFSKLMAFKCSFFTQL